MAFIREENSFPDIKVQLVKSFPDLKVYVTKNKLEARGKDEIWCFERDQKAVKVKFVTSFPDLKVQYVTSKINAGWANKTHKLQNRIG